MIQKIVKIGQDVTSVKKNITKENLLANVDVYTLCEEYLDGDLSQKEISKATGMNKDMIRKLCQEIVLERINKFKHEKKFYKDASSRVDQVAKNTNAQETNEFNG